MTMGAITVHTERKSKIKTDSNDLLVTKHSLVGQFKWDKISMSFFTVLATIWFFLLAVKMIKVHFNFKLIKEVSPGSPKDHWPLVSVVVPACNEETHIESAARSLLSMDYPQLEVIFVNDRSTDQTGAILQRIVKADPRAQLITVEKIPLGWLGKVNALHQGELKSKGEWVLFSDADVHLSPKTLKKAIHYVTQQELDFLAICPRFICRTFFLKTILIPFFQSIFIFSSKKRLHDPHKSDAIGSGSFNLVRKESLKASSGFEALKAEVIDDTGLAYVVKKTGGRLSFLGGVGEVEVEWYRDLPAFIHGLEKNSFSLFQYSLKALWIYTLGVWVITAITLILPWFSQNEYLLALFGISLFTYLMLSGLVTQKTVGLSPWLAFTLPLTFPLLPFVYLRSAYHVLRRKGVVWRGVHYSLEFLRQHQQIRLLDSLFKSKS